MTFGENPTSSSSVEERENGHPGVRRFLDNLGEIQYGADRPILLFTQDMTGLGSQISRRLLGLSLAYKFRRKVVFPSVSEPPYTQVFEPLHSSIDYSKAETEAVDFFSPDAERNHIVKLDYWDLIRNKALIDELLTFVPPEITAIEPSRYFFDGLLLSFCRLTQTKALYVEAAAERLGIGEDTLGVHVRRGDKRVETPFVPISAVNEAIARVSAQRRLHKVFVCSDSPSIAEKIRLPAGATLIWDTQERRYNNANHRLLLGSPDLAEQETLTAVKNVYLLARCGALIGQDNAHFATLAAGMIAFRSMRPDFGCLLRGDHALESSRQLKIWYSVKTRVRAAARFLMPWMTIRAATKRSQSGQ